jgi:hypothetical protein
VAGRIGSVALGTANAAGFRTALLAVLAAATYADGSARTAKWVGALGTDNNGVFVTPVNFSGFDSCFIAPDGALGGVSFVSPDTGTVGASACGLITCRTPGAQGNIGAANPWASGSTTGWHKCGGTIGATWVAVGAVETDEDILIYVETSSNTVSIIAQVGKVIDTPAGGVGSGWAEAGDYFLGGWSVGSALTVGTFNSNTIGYPCSGANDNNSHFYIIRTTGASVLLAHMSLPSVGPVGYVTPGGTAVKIPIPYVTIVSGFMGVIHSKYPLAAVQGYINEIDGEPIIGMNLTTSGIGIACT